MTSVPRSARLVILCLQAICRGAALWTPRVAWRSLCASIKTMAERNNDSQKTYWRYGGQAVIEGVMMRSMRFFAVACRAPDGQIIIHSEALNNTLIGKLMFMNRPFLRGILMLIDSLALGLRALNFSSMVQIQNDPAHKEKPLPKSLYDFAIGATAFVGFGIGILLFFVLPTLLTDWLKAAHWTAFQQNMVDGIIRIAIFLGYVSVIGLMPDIRRVFQYHGAEHKAINALEEGHGVSIESARAQTRLHPRCGTSFVLLVLVISIFVFALTGRPPWYIRLPLHLSLLPLIASATYEIIRLAGRFRNQTMTRILLAPGMWSQYLTTREPTDDQIEVAVASLQRVMDLEEGRVPDSLEEPVPVETEATVEEAGDTEPLAETETVAQSSEASA